MADSILFKAASLGEIYGLIVDSTMRGKRIEPRGKACREIRPVVIETPMTNCVLHASGTNYRIGIAELMMLVAGWQDIAFLRHVTSNFDRFSDDGGYTSWGGYGARIHYPVDQLSAVVHRLNIDPDTRQAVLAFWRPEADAIPANTEKKDYPCNTHAYFKIRDGKLDVSVMRRSADVVWGLPLDTFLFSWLGAYIASQSYENLELGTLTQFIDSLHIYEESAGYYDEARRTQALHTKPINVERLVPDVLAFPVLSMKVTKLGLILARQFYEHEKANGHDGYQVAANGLSWRGLVKDRFVDFCMDQEADPEYFVWAAKLMHYVFGGMWSV